MADSYGSYGPLCPLDINRVKQTQLEAGSTVGQQRPSCRMCSCVTTLSFAHLYLQSLNRFLVWTCPSSIAQLLLDAAIVERREILKVEPRHGTILRVRSPQESRAGVTTDSTSNA